MAPIRTLSRGFRRSERSQQQPASDDEFPFCDLNANDVEAAMKVIAGTARSMGIEVVD